MWDKTSFDPVAIDKELALAERTGLNKIILSFCDVVTFHNYADLKGLTAGLDSLSAIYRGGTGQVIQYHRCGSMIFLRATARRMIRRKLSC